LNETFNLIDISKSYEFDSVMKSKYFSNKILFIVPLFYYNFLSLFHVTLIA